jgi:hypothetical protein
MKDRKQSEINRMAELTAGEHLWLHQEMERRSHELWLAGGCRRRAALSDWLQAERETWKKFMRRRPGTSAFRKQCGGALGRTKSERKGGLS